MMFVEAMTITSIPPIIIVTHYNCNSAHYNRNSQLQLKELYEQCSSIKLFEARSQTLKALSLWFKFKLALCFYKDLALVWIGPPV